MKVVLLIFLMFTLALGQYNNKPCQPTKDPDSYDEFRRKHILQRDFDRNSGDEWKKYLKENKLCERPRQTFMEKKDQGQVEQICKGQGWLFKSDSNLCISSSPINVYDLRVNTKKCKIKTLDSGLRYVVVACDAVGNVCRPVHFDKSKDTDEDKTNQKCSA